MVDTGFNSPAYSSSLRNSEPLPPSVDQEDADATVISARFSSRNLLTDCWTKACEFARNFNALHIDIDHLLLGASHVRDAEAALSVASDNIEELTHDLARLCARRSFAEVPDNNEAYEASQSLQIILCEAAALATRQGGKNLTLSLVIEALAKTDPKPAVLEVLPKLNTRIEAERTKHAEGVKLLSNMNAKIEGMSALLNADLRDKLGAFDSYIGQAVAASIAPMEHRLQHNIGQRVDAAVQQSHQTSEDSKNKVFEAVRILPNMIANMVGERVAHLEEPESRSDNDGIWRWFHFWRSGRGD